MEAQQDREMQALFLTSELGSVSVSFKQIVLR